MHWSRGKTRKYWQQVKESYTREATAFVEDVTKIEDRELRFAVSVILDSVSEDCCTLRFASVDGTKLQFLGIKMDEEVLAALLNQLNDNERLQEALNWIFQRLRNQDGSFLGFLFGALHFDDPTAGGFYTKNIYYDLKEQRIKGILGADTYVAGTTAPFYPLESLE